MRLIFATFAAAALAACGSASNPDAAAERQKADIGDTDVQFSDVEPMSVAPPATDPVCSEAGTMCAGPLLVRSEGFNLFADGNAQDDGARYLRMRGTLVISNRTANPVKFAVLDLPIGAALDNGGQLEIVSNGVSGVTVCGRGGAECLQGTPERFQTLAAGESPARLGFTFSGRTDGSLAASLPTIATSDVSLQLFAVGGDNEARTLNIQLARVPIRNQLSQ